MSSRCYCVSGKSWRRCYLQVVLTTPIVLALTHSATHLIIQTAPSVTTTTVLQVNISSNRIIIITFNIFSLSRISLSTFVKYFPALFAKKPSGPCNACDVCFDLGAILYVWRFDCQKQWQDASATSTAPLSTLFVEEVELQTLADAQPTRSALDTIR